jgi:hypothetical protein
MAGFTPEEAAAIRQQELEDIQRFGRASDETRRQLMDLSVGVKGTTEGLTRNFKALGTSGVSLVKELNAGAVGASVFNNSIGSVANALGDLLGTIPYVGTALKTIVKGASEYTQAVNQSADRLYSTYKELGEMGAATAGGMQDVYNNVKKLNLSESAADLQKFSGMVRENSQTLAYFGTTVGGGVKEFANIAQSIQQSDVGAEFRDMGISVDEINKGILSFTKMQMLTGGRQKMTTDQLVAASQDYIREVDMLAKLTGKNRAEQEAAKESAMAEERYAGYKSELADRAKLGDKAAEEQLKQAEATQTMLDKLAPETRKGFLNVLSGTLDTPEAAKLLQTMPEAYAVAAKQTFTQAEFQEAALRDLKSSNRERSIALSKMGANDDTYLKLSEQNKLIAAFESGTIDERKAAAREASKLTDKNTADMGKIEDENRKSRDKLNDLINVGIGPVTTSMKGLASATESTIEGMTKMAEKLGVTVTKREAAPAAPSGAAPAAAPAPTGGAAAPSRPGGSLSERIIQAESGGRNIANQSGPGGRATSSAFGLAQITKGTFEGLAKSAAPGSALFGKTFDDMKVDEGLQREALSQLSDKNRAVLAKANVSTSDAAMYLAHFLGPGGAVKALQAGDSAVLSSAVSSKQIEANPNLQKMATVGDLKAWADKKMGGGGYRFGGIATGPEEGYDATLHGTEAVVPLPDGRTIPVQMMGADQQTGIMAAQLARLDDIMRVMQNQLSVSENILKYAQ